MTRISLVAPEEASAEAKTHAELRARIAWLGRNASFEATSAEILQDGFASIGLAHGTRIYIPHVANTEFADIVQAAGRVRSLGLRAVPHIAARRLNSKQELDDLLRGLRGVGCRDLLLIGGSARRPKSEFASVRDVVRTGLLQTHGMAQIGVAGHPEGSPDIRDEDLASALAEKNRFAQQEHGIRMHLVTQFCFAPQPILAWEERIRTHGNRLPVHVGVPGLTSMTSLLRFAALCGVRVSADFLRGGMRKIARAPLGWSPGAVVLKIAERLLSRPGCLFNRMHFFPFGGLKQTVSWVNALAQGRFELEESSSGLELARVEV